MVQFQNQLTLSERLIFLIKGLFINLDLSKSHLLGFTGLIFSYFLDLIWIYSISKGHFSIPKIWTARKASIEGMELVKKKIFLKNYIQN